MEFSPKKRVKCRRYCSVPFCKSLAEKDTTVSFHRFPNESQVVNVQDAFGNVVSTSRRKEWSRRLKIGKHISDWMYVCSRHFSSEDYILPGITAQKRYLRPTAVPSVNLPQGSVDRKHRSQQRTPRAPRSTWRPPTSSTQSRAEATVTTEEASRSTLLEDQLPEHDSPQTSLANLGAACMTDISQDTATEKELSSFTRETGIQVGGTGSNQDAETQVTSGDFIIPFTNLIDTPQKLNTATGLPSFNVLEVLVEFVTSCNDSSKFRALDQKSMVILTLMKLKLNLTFVLLSMLFRVSSNTCKNIFKDTLCKLALALKRCIPWPSKEEIISNMPQCFNKFKKVRIVLDCTEIYVMKPKCLKCRVKSYSHYKGTNTVKYLIGVTPAGLISFVSEGFGGRASDKAITEMSGIIGKLDSINDEVMVDKGFLIDSLCDEHNVKLHRPPFLRKQQQFTKSESDATRHIARARVHVERAIQRIRIYKLLNGRVPWELVVLCDNMMVVAAAIANLSSPILADNKF